MRANAQVEVESKPIKNKETMERKIIGFVRYNEGCQSYRQGIEIKRNIHLHCHGETSFEELISLREKFIEPLEESGEWTTETGNPIGLTNAELATGICHVELDYVSYYTTTIDQLDEDEWKALFAEEGDCWRGVPALADEMIAYLEREFDLCIDINRLEQPNSLNELYEYLVRYNPCQDEFEEAMYKVDEDEL